jgi:hypothetical protein
MVLTRSHQATKVKRTISAALFLVIFVPLCEDLLCLRPPAALRTTR